MISKFLSIFNVKMREMAHWLHTKGGTSWPSAYICKCNLTTHTYVFICMYAYVCMRIISEYLLKLL